MGCEKNPIFGAPFRLSEAEFLAGKLIIYVCKKFPRWFFPLRKFGKHWLTTLQFRCLKCKLQLFLLPNCSILQIFPSSMHDTMTHKLTQSKNLGMVLDVLFYFTFCKGCISKSSRIYLHIYIYPYIFKLFLFIFIATIGLSHYHFSLLLEKPTISHESDNFNYLLKAI